jgi:hypothetical protein
MAITAKSRASLRLSCTTSLSPNDTLECVRRATDDVHGGGSSLLTSGVRNIGAQIHVEEYTTTGLGLSITSGKRLLELCTFNAHVQETEGRTRLLVGGLATYKTTQEKLFFFIPIGPKAIAGISPYKRFLDAVSAQLTAKDGNAAIDISVPTADR